MNATPWTYEGKTALVTGAAKRIGRAVAISLARRGVRVVVHYRTSRSEAADLVGEIAFEGGRACALQADLEDADAIGSLFAEAVSCAGPIDILINNASTFLPSTLEDLDALQFDEELRLHCAAPLQLTQAMYAQEREGVVVNLLDARIRAHDARHFGYSASKRLLAELTRMCAIACAPRLRVNAVAPGPILPPEGADAAYLESVAQRTLLRRHGSPDDVVRAIHFLIESGLVTGQIVFVDGGQHLKGTGDG